jgi:AcrR family transcriptional regulator
MRYALYLDSIRMSTRAAPRLTRAESQARTRARVLDAAEQLFGQSGYHGVTIDAIVERAGFTRGAFYANFSDKADVFLTLLEERNESNFQQLRDQISGDEREDFDEMRRWFERGFTQFGALEVAYAEFQPLAATNPEYAGRLATRVHAVRQSAAELAAREFERNGYVLTVSPEQFATMAMALVDGFSVLHRLDPDGAPLDTLIEAIQCLVRGARQPPA